MVVGYLSGGFVAVFITEPRFQAKVRKTKGQSGGIIGILNSAE